MPQTVRRRALAIFVAVAVVLAVGILVIANRGPAHAAPEAHADGSSDVHREAAGWLSFRLPDLNHALIRTNRINLAKSSSSSAPLLVFLPATGARPSDYREFLRTASAQGFSVLGLDYWNIGRSLTRTCLADARCYTQFQTNRFNGGDPSRFSHIGAANSILNRLQDALTYLTAHDPHGHWSQYTGASGVDWSRIVVAGHSQGGGEAAFISHRFSVRGALMFSSPVETYRHVSAGWMDRHGATPVSRLYGFDDIHDVYHDRITGSWRRLGMGDPSMASAVSVPTGGHMLLSSLDIGTPAQAHYRDITDSGPKTSTGAPLFEPTWRWMLQQVR